MLNIDQIVEQEYCKKRDRDFRKERAWYILVLICWIIFMMITVMGLPNTRLPYKYIEISPSQDTFVDSNDPAAIYGMNTTLNASSTKYIFLKYNLADLPVIDILSIEFRIENGSETTYTILYTESYWAESDLCYQTLLDNDNYGLRPNLPVHYRVIGTYPQTTNVTTDELINIIGNDDIITIVITTSSEIAIQSREFNEVSTLKLRVFYSGILLWDISILILGGFLFIPLALYTYRRSKIAQLEKQVECNY